MKLKNKLTMVAMVVATLMACTVEDGDQGPVGPIGPEGPPGRDGDGAGTVGPAGEDGNANVSSKTYLVNGTDFTVNGSYSRDTITEPLLTKEVVDNGAVQLFIVEGASTTNVSWNPLPHRLIYNVGGNGTFVNFSYSYAQNNLYLNLITESGTGVNFPNTIEWSYKLVVIPPADRIEGVDYTDWEQVQMVYGFDEEEVILQQ